MARRDGQTMVLFGFLALVLIGFLGLAVDGGYYFASSRTVSIAADAAARAAAVRVMDAQGGPLAVAGYAQATSDGLAIGEQNLGSANVTGVTMTIEYNDSLSATPTSGGWYSSTPGPSTATVRAVVTGSYPTLFLRAVGVPSMPIQRLGQGGPLTPVISIPRSLPLSVCSTTVLTNPNGPWTLWTNQNPRSVCLVLSWSGLTNIDNRAPITCADYQNWLGPPLTGPIPLAGDNVTIDMQICDQFGNWAQPLSGTTQVVPEISPLPNLLGAQVVGCRQVRLTAVSAVSVQGRPIGGRVPCGVQQTY
jgi:Flp pilus assembly protein TadG